jgi:DNA ligase-1
MKKLTKSLFALLLISPQLLWAIKPAVMLAEKYHDQISVSDYWVSEKLDGVRARWDGSKLISRGGHEFAAPAWFTKDFPSVALDGELWSKRGDYENVSSITSRHQAHEGWKEIKLMVFDLPKHGGRFFERVAEMAKLDAPYLKPVSQFRVENSQQLMTLLDQHIAAGSEGLMLHHQDAVYKSGRSGDLLKFKRFDDAEAIVLEHIGGNGKFTGMLGAIVVRDDRGKEFKIGSGFSDAERRSPPPIGTKITFKHQSYTKYGIPRFPIYLRIRRDGQ